MKIHVYIFISICIFLFLSSKVYAEKPQKVVIGTYIINIGKYDISTGSYTADFYLWFKWNGTISPEKFEFMNGRANKITTLIDQPGYKFYRVEAQFYTNSQLRNYPIDHHDLFISIEDQVLTTKDMIYIPDYSESDINPNLSIIGWEIIHSNISVSTDYYKNWDESYSNYVHKITISRPVSTMLKTLIPIIFIALTAWLCFFIPLHKFGEKLALGGTSLLSAVAFHIYITSSLPAVGYLTLADKLIIALYAMLVTILIGMIKVENYVNNKKIDQAQRRNEIYKIISLIIPIIALSMLLFL